MTGPVFQRVSAILQIQTVFLAAAVCILLTLLPLPSQAVELEFDPGISLLKGSFPNGTEFKLNTLTGELVFESPASLDPVSNFTIPGVAIFPYLKFGPNQFLGGGIYFPKPEDRMVFFGTEDRLLVLTENGLLRYLNDHPKLHPDTQKFIPMARANLFCAKTREAYGVWSVKFDNGTAQTGIIRLADGEIRTLDKTYRPALSGIAISEDGLTLHLEDKQNRDIQRIFGGKPKKNHLKNAPGSTSPQLRLGKFGFMSGTNIYFQTGADTNITIELPDGTRKRLAGEEAIARPANDGPESEYEYDWSSGNKLAFVMTPSTAWVVNDQGNASPLPLNFDRLFQSPGLAGAINTKTIRHGDHQFLVVSIEAKNDPGLIDADTLSRLPENHREEIEAEVEAMAPPGETFIIREDGTSVRIDYQFHEVREDNTHIHNGILSIEGVARQIDLDRFDAEAAWKVHRPQLIESNSGLPVLDPVNMIDQQLENLFDTVRDEPENFFDTVDTQGYTKKMEVALLDWKAGNFVLLGPAGTGKKTRLKSFIKDVWTGKATRLPRTIRAYVLNRGNLSRGSKWVGSIDSRIEAIIEACRRVPCLLVMEDLPSLRGIGTSAYDSNDIFTNFRSPISQNLIKIAATAVTEEYKEYFAGDPEIDGKLRKIEINPSKEEDTLLYMANWERQKGLPETPREMLREIYHLSEEFIAETTQPDRAITLYSSAASLAHHEAGKPAPVAIQHVHEALTSYHGAKEAYFKPEEMRKLLSNVRNVLDEMVIGQHWAKDVAQELIFQKLTRTQDPNQPGGRMAAVGPPGVGKSILGYAMGKALGVDVDRIDMNLFTNGDIKSFKRRLAQAVRKHGAHVLIILDEIDKAPKEVIEVLLGIYQNKDTTIEERSASGEIRHVGIDFRHAFFYETGNLGEELIAKLSGKVQTEAGFHTKPGESRVGSLTSMKLKDSLGELGYSRPFLSRHERVVAVFPPTLSELKEVVRLHVKKIEDEQRLRQGVSKIEIRNLDAFVELSALELGKDASNRDAVQEMVNVFVRNAIAQAVIRGDVKRGEALTLDFDRESFLKTRTTVCENSLARAR